MKEYDIRDFGAVCDEGKNNAPAIQAAIDACAENGGGRVTVAGGTYMTGMIELRSHVTLYLADDGVLLASPNRDDFPEKERRHVDASKLSRFSAAAMIFAEECENISIVGKGKIDGNGYAYVEPCAPYHSGWHYKRKGANTLPRVVFFTGCKSVRVEDITAVDAPAGWMFWVHDCDLVDFSRVKILCDPILPNADGIHINSSRDVTVTDSVICTGDDCIVARAANRSLHEPKICERVTVKRCTLTSHTNAIRLGWVGDGVIRDCSFLDITVDATRTGITAYLPPASVAFSDNTPQTSGTSGISRGLTASVLERTRIENITFKNITMTNIYLRPIEIEIDPAPDTPCDAIRDLTFENIRAQSLGFPTLKGRADCPLVNIRFLGCDFRTVPKEKISYVFEPTPEELSPMLIRYAENITFTDTSFSSEE